MAISGRNDSCQPCLRDVSNLTINKIVLFATDTPRQHSSMKHENSYRQNAVTGATANPFMPTPDTIDEEFAEAANDVLRNAVELVRDLIGAHQAAIAIVINKDWRYVRKFFSLSEKYRDWADYKTPAVGYGTHAWLLEHNALVRYTQAELEAHPDWHNFGTEAGKHPPMRGWMAAPLLDKAGKNWGLIQLSDKYETESTAAVDSVADFDADDEARFHQFAVLVSKTLDALWEVRNLKKGLVP